MHRCPVPGCTRDDIPYNVLMCGFHWLYVPSLLKRRVYRAWDRFNADPVAYKAEFFAVREEAIAEAAHAPTGREC